VIGNGHRGLLHSALPTVIINMSAETASGKPQPTTIVPTTIVPNCQADVGSVPIGLPVASAKATEAKSIEATWIAQDDERNREPAHERESAERALVEAELQRAKAVAEAANEAKTRYLTSVCHEIRAPLNAIYGYAQLLERGEAISASEAGTVIRRSAEHLTNLVEGMLEISRVESGAIEVRKELVEFPHLLAHVLDMFRMQARAKNIDLRFEPRGRVPRFVCTDEKRLRQILINLLSNAIKYTRAGNVTVSVSYRSQVAEVVISDTGIGIAPEDLQLIFQPFERGSSPEAALQPGIGLGLAITRTLSRILGGEIVAMSTPGVGSQFKLSLFLPEPFSPPVDSADCRQVTGYQGPRRTVLVIDDHLTQVDILDSLLRQLDFVVYAAGNGAEGLALAERCRPDLVLLDIEMPGISGWEVAARLRADHGDAVRIVMVSANAQQAPSVGKSALPHDAAVAKPVDQNKLLATIGQQLNLAWEYAGEPSLPAVADLPAAVPKQAEGYITRIRQFAEVGHIRAVEAALTQLGTDVPASAPTVAAMRDYVGNFDLRSLMKMLDGIQYE
jgi:signal transduction histidine kinase/ActR/RegA family two-component response regulator